MSKSARNTDIDSASGPLMTELGATSLKSFHPLDDSPIPFATDDPNVVRSRHGDSLTAGPGNDGADQASIKIDSLISAQGITPNQEGDGGLKLTGLAEAASRLDGHLDGTFLNSVAARVSGFWPDPPTTNADGSATHTDAVASTSATPTATSLTISSALGADPIFETRVAAAGDDVEEKGSGSISSNINDLELGYDGTTRQTVGIRFTGVDIPKGAIITSAYIQFQANEVKTGATSLLIQGDNTDDANPFTAASFNVSSLPRTTASTAWTPDPWTAVGDHGLAERTPDLTAIVQEIVNRSGWSALNHMAFIITGTGTRTADSYEYNPASAPLLHVEYLLPAGSPVAFNTPPDADTAANQIAELAAVGTAIGITASATDPDAGSTVTYSLNDARFAINSSTGVIMRSATGTLDFETQSSINLTVTATSSDGSTANQTYTLAVLDSPEPVAFNTPPDTDPTVNQIAELAASGTAIGITASATDPDAGSTVTYSINDTRFAIDSSTGVITRSGTGTLDFETQSSINLTVTATSSDGSTANQTYTLAVLDSPEPVAFNTPPDADTATNQIAQNAAAGAAIGITASARDPDTGSTVTYTIDDPRFAINSTTGVITRSATGTLNATNEPSVTLTVTATSSDGSIDTHAFDVAVTASQLPVAFNAPPDADPNTNQIAELAAAGTAIGITASATDPDAGSTVTYSLNDTRFAIDSSTGVITRSGTGTLDFETQSSINLTVTATSSDGSTANQSFALAVLDSPEPVAFNTPADTDNAANQIAQSAAAGTAVGITASARDPDAGSTVTYSINDSRFAINSSTGVITRSGTGTLNATTEPTINLTVTATSSDGSTDTHAYSVAVSGTSSTPVIFETRVATAGDDVEQKNSGAMSTNVTDLELGYDGSTAQTDGLRFAGINIPKGAVITNAYIQFQANEVKTGATSLLIQGDNVDDASAFTNVKFNVSSLPRTTASVAWTPAPWTTVGEHGLAERTPDLTAIVQEIVNRSGWAALNHMAFLITGTGTRTADSYEYNPASAPLLHIEYTLPGPAGGPVAFNTPPDADTATNQIAELAAAGTAIGITASATDPDVGSTVAYSLDDARFAINSSTGVITRSGTGTLDFETQSSINLTVTATSSDGSTANQTFTLAVLDSPEPVAFNTPPDADTTANQITQNAVAGTAVGITASAKDPDAGSTVTYSINDPRFAINPSTGVITRSGTGTLNATTEPTINLHVTATSSDGSTAAQDYALGVTTGPVFQARIGSSADDVEQGPTGGMDLISTHLDMVVSGTKVETVGMRFTSVDIPYDAVITNAYIQFQAQNTGTGAMSLLIRGESDEATPFESEINDVTSRPMTNASVTWTPPDWTVINEAGLAERTPNLSAIVQEIINQPGYLQLNDMAFVVSGSSGTRSAYSFDGSAAGAPLLHIEYYVPTTGPVSFKHPQDADSAANQIVQNAAAGTLVHITASAKDPDVADKVTYSINDSRFAIDANTGVITRSGTGTLNAATEPSINLHVTATSSDGSTAGQDYSLSVVPVTAPQVLYRYAVFGDYGDTDLSGEKAVSAMVHAWNVDFILTVGDNVYAPQAMDAAVGQQYHDYIGNYQGAYGSGSSINRFFPTLGNHEYNENNVTNYLNYFTLPDNERYYDFQIGPVHFFALNSNKQEPDGRSSTSVQGHWLQNLLATSDASFNVAYFHHTPYNPAGFTATMQWPFEQWGVNAVFAGHEHNYYRENRDDNGDGVFLPYTTTGLGGAGKTVPDVGANLVTVTDQGMLIEFYKVSSFNGTTATPVLTDSYFVPTPAGRTPTIVNGGYVLNGTTGADYLWGLGGNDTLIGGRGNDTLVAGNQHNLFVFAHGDGQDTVMNFLPGAGTGDVLDLRAFGIYNASQFLQVATNQGSNVVATLGGGDQITLTGVHVEQFHNDNFVSSLLLA